MLGPVCENERIGSRWIRQCNENFRPLIIYSQVQLECQVTGGEQLSDKTWKLHTRNGDVKTQVVVNAAGLHGDRVENMCRPSKFT